MKKFIRKNLIAIIAIALIIAGGGGAYAAISSHDADMGANPLHTEADDGTYVFPEGYGYHLSGIQTGKYQLPEKIEYESAGDEGFEGDDDGTDGFGNTFAGNGFRYSGGTGTKWRYTRHTFKVTITPNFSTNLVTKSKETYKEGSTLDFYIEGRAYNGRTLTQDEIVVKYDGKTITGKESGPRSFSYSITVAKGSKDVVITVTDTKKPTAKNTTGSKTREGKFTIKGKAKEDKSFRVTGKANLETIADAPELPSAEAKSKDGEDIKVSSLIASMFKGSSFKYASDSDGYIVSITGFEKNTDLAMANPEEISNRIYGSYDPDAFVSTQNSGKNGTLANGAFGLDTARWMIINGDREVTLDDVIKSGDDHSLIIVFNIFKDYDENDGVNN